MCAVTCKKDNQVYIIPPCEFYSYDGESSMSLFAFVLIVCSAFMHASWNLLAKRSVMSVAFYTAICMTAMTLWLHVQFWTPVKVADLPGIFWIYLLCSVLFDMCYCFGLKYAYRTMEMSTAYPMMRALPLLMTAIVVAATGWGAPLTPLAIIGMVVVFIGCLMMPLPDFASFKLKNYLNRQMFFIFLVACGTTGYTILDSQSQAVLRTFIPQISKPVLSVTFYSTRGIVLSSLLLSVVMMLPGERKNFLQIFKERNLMPVWAGVFASLTYTSVLLAMNYVSNVAYVQVFRQLGLIFAAAGGIFILKEHCHLPKIAGIILILSGLVITVL